jgi:HK97 family phage major capsid protein
MSNTTSNTAELTAEQVQRILVQPLGQASTFLAAGPKIIDSANPVRIPKLGGMVDEGTSTPAAPGWVSETGDIPVKDIKFADIQLMPSTMEALKVITKFSNQMARQSILALDAVMQAKVVGDVATVLDQQFWGYGGDGITQPRGILSYAGQTLDKANTALTLDDLIDAWGLALSAHVNMAGLRWVMRPETFTALRKVKETTGSNRSVLTPDPSADAVFRLLGSQVIVTDHLPLGPDSNDADSDANEQNVLLYDASQVVVARDLAPSVTILKELFQKTDEQGIKVVSRYDAAPLNDQAVIRIKNIAA